MTTLVIVFAGITPGAVSAERSSTQPNRYLESAMVRPLRHNVVDRRVATWTHQDKLGEHRWSTAYQERRTHSVPYLKWLQKLWAHRADKAYRKVISGLWLKDFSPIPGNNAWVKAVDEVQRPYPNTYEWLKSCSSSEGAGRSLSIDYFVMNHQGSGAGGWLQFMSSTFWRMFSQAKADVQNRGYKLPGSAASWSSPLGQALAGGWAVTHSGTGEWSGANC